MDATRVDQGRYLTESEANALLTLCGNRAEADRAAGRQQGIREQIVVELALHTGARVCELARLTVGDVDVARKGMETLRVWTAKQRAAKQRTLPLKGRVLDVVRAYLADKAAWGEPMGLDSPLVCSKRGEGLTKRGWQATWLRAIERYRIGRRLSIHDARHTVGVRLARRGNLVMAQRVLGHADIQTTARYYATATIEELGDAMARP